MKEFNRMAPLSMQRRWFWFNSFPFLVLRRWSQNSCWFRKASKKLQQFRVYSYVSCTTDRVFCGLNLGSASVSSESRTSTLVKTWGFLFSELHIKITCILVIMEISFKFHIFIHPTVQTNK